MTLAKQNYIHKLRADYIWRMHAIKSFPGLSKLATQRYAQGQVD